MSRSPNYPKSPLYGSPFSRGKMDSFSPKGRSISDKLEKYISIFVLVLKATNSKYNDKGLTHPNESLEKYLFGKDTGGGSTLIPSPRGSLDLLVLIRLFPLD